MDTTMQPQDKHTKSLDEYIEYLYPHPQDDGDADWNFYRQWGYEQWLIKRFHYNLEQLRILTQPDYNLYRLAEWTRDRSLEKAFAGCELVRAKHLISQFMRCSMPKGTVGVATWKEHDGNWFCIFPKHVNAAFGQIMRGCRDDEIEMLGVVYTTERALLDIQPTDRVAYGFMLEWHIVLIPNVGPRYVKRAFSGGCSNHCGPIDVVEAVAGKTVKWKRKPNAPVERIYISDEQFEDIRILK